MAEPFGASEAGAVLTFEGVVRPTEDDQPIDALEYDAYRPMADDMLRQLALDMIERHGVTAIAVEHSIGRIGAGQRSFRLQVASPHRVEGLAAAAEFITLMKKDIPIFKVPVPA